MGRYLSVSYCKTYDCIEKPYQNSAAEPAMQIVDLTQPIYDGMPVYPGDPEVRIREVQEVATSGWSVRQLSLGSHTGTHVDAFSHASPEGLAIDAFPVDRFVGRAVCLAPGDAIPADVGILLAGHAATTLTDGILAASPPFVGAPSLDEALERALLSAGILTYEGLTNLDRLPRDRSFLFCGLPLPIRGGDGSPVRAVAILD